MEKNIPSIIIISENCLLLDLTMNNLSKKEIEITIVTPTDDINEVAEKYKKTTSVTVGNPDNNKDKIYDYCIFIYQGEIIDNQKLQIHKNIYDKLFGRVVHVVEKNKSRTVLVSPLLKERILKNYFDQMTKAIKDEDNIKNIFHGLITEDSANKNFILNRVYAEMIENKKIYLPNIKDVHLIDAKDLANFVVRQTFSFFEKLDQSVINIKPIGINDLSLLIKDIDPKAKTGISKKEFMQEESKSNFFIHKEANDLFKIGYHKFVNSILHKSRNKQDYPENEETPKHTKHKNINATNLKWSFIIPFAFIFLSISTFLLMLTAPLFLLAKNESENGRLKNAEWSFKATGVLSKTAYNHSRLLSRIPIIGNYYNSVGELSLISANFSEVGIVSIDVVQDIQALTEIILTNNNQDPETIIEELSIDLQQIYNKTGFLQSEIYDSMVARRLVEKSGLRYDDVVNLRVKLFFAEKLVRELPELLGKGEKRDYMVLLQNNMELRPAGGFIGSFAIISFDNFKLNNIEIFDVYSADGQLEGHVEPPEAIKKYLNQATWYLRDSNWDPDFEKSARNAEWFLKKEINREVDGVVAIDLNYVKKLIENFGEIRLEDFDRSINNENFYEVVQSEVERHFFPGSRKKANFLTSLQREITTKLTEANSSQEISIAKQTLNSLDERNIQIFIHNSQAQKAIQSLGWSGEILINECLENCYEDYLGFVEANLGVNKVNYYIDRKISVKSLLKNDVIEKEVKIQFINKAEQTNEGLNVYKNYMRIISDSDTDFMPVEIINEDESRLVEPDIKNLGRNRKDAGIYFEVEPQKSVSVVFTLRTKTNIDLNKSGYYSMFLRKQAGIDSYDLNMSVTPENREQNYTSDNLVLTEDGTFVYNTQSVKDNTFRIYW